VADSTISALTAAAAAADTDEFPINQGGVAKKVTRAQMFTSPRFGSYADLAGIAAPAAPAAGDMRMFSVVRATHPFLAMMGQSGVVRPIQTAIFDNAVYWWSPTSAVAGLWVGTVGAGLGTYTNTLPTTTNIFTTIRRGRFANIVTTTNQEVGQRGTEAIFFRGSSAGMGGFFFFCRFGLGAWNTGGRLFVGLSAVSAAAHVTVQPSTLLNMVGFGIDAADTTITFMHNDGTSTATKTAIAGQPALTANQGYDAYIFMRPNDGTIYYRLDNINTGANIVDSSTATDVPVAGTMMAPSASVGNAALTTAGAVAIDIADIYLETDK
jgi:hypothetical protein